MNEVTIYAGIATAIIGSGGVALHLMPWRNAVITTPPRKQLLAPKTFHWSRLCAACIAPALVLSCTAIPETRYDSAGHTLPPSGRKVLERQQNQAKFAFLADGLHVIT